MTKNVALAMVLVMTLGARANGQTQPTQAELDQWKKDPKANVLETSPCKKITWLIESENKTEPNENKRSIQYALGWWGRGFIEGAVYTIDNDKVLKKAQDFGLSVDVVSAHIKTYCYVHQTETPFEAVQDLLLKVVK
jgi:hypothetical protein